MRKWAGVLGWPFSEFAVAVPVAVRVKLETRRAGTKRVAPPRLDRPVLGAGGRPRTVQLTEGRVRSEKWKGRSQKLIHSIK